MTGIEGPRALGKVSRGIPRHKNDPRVPVRAAAACHADRPARVSTLARLFYAGLTAYLGFEVNESEYKVMGRYASRGRRPGGDRRTPFEVQEVLDARHHLEDALGEPVALGVDRWQDAAVVRRRARVRAPDECEGPDRAAARDRQPPRSDGAGRDLSTIWTNASWRDAQE